MLALHPTLEASDIYTFPNTVYTNQHGITYKIKQHGKHEISEDANIRQHHRENLK
jgi:hypothetical protein